MDANPDMALNTVVPKAVLEGGQRVYRVWIAFGVLMLGVQAWVLGRWITSAHFHPAPVGPDPIPASDLLHVRIIEGLTLAAFVLALWFLVLRPLLRREPFAAANRLFIAMASTYWLDTLYNYTNVTWYYNAYTLNLGSWASFIPGWSTPGHETFPEPLLAAACLWFIAFGAAARGGAWLYGRLRQRVGPQALLRPFALLWAAGALLGTAYENLFIRMDVFGYIGTWRPLTLWAGTEYQFPLYEGPMTGLVVAVISLLLYHCNGHGEMICERGIHRIDVTPRARTALATLATIGCAHAVILVLWMMPYQWFALHVNASAELPSYKRGGICGEGTPYACPDGRFGVPTRYTTPAFIVAPGDTRLR